MEEAPFEEDSFLKKTIILLLGAILIAAAVAVGVYFILPQPEVVEYTPPKSEYVSKTVALQKKQMLPVSEELVEIEEEGTTGGVDTQTSQDVVPISEEEFTALQHDTMVVKHEEPATEYVQGLIQEDGLEDGADDVLPISEEEAKKLLVSMSPETVVKTSTTPPTQEEAQSLGIPNAEKGLQPVSLKGVVFATYPQSKYFTLINDDFTENTPLNQYNVVVGENTKVMVSGSRVLLSSLSVDDIVTVEGEAYKQNSVVYAQTVTVVGKKEFIPF